MNMPLLRQELRLRAGGRDLEVCRLGLPDNAQTTLVFLHEGLGCVRLWRDFPERLCGALDLPGLVYSRAGYGDSQAAELPRSPRFMHEEAHEVLPELLRAAGIGRYLLVGHSDGGSIALLHASQRPPGLQACLVMAPHLFVETITVEAIRAIDQRFQAGNLSAKLARYHRDPTATFRGWVDIWLAPEFVHWNIEAPLSTMAVPILAIQGIQDEYGSLEQLHRLVARHPQTRCLILDECGHSPFIDQPTRVIEACQAFLGEFGADTTAQGSTGEASEQRE